MYLVHVIVINNWRIERGASWLHDYPSLFFLALMMLGFTAVAAVATAFYALCELPPLLLRRWIGNVQIAHASRLTPPGDSGVAHGII
jgi:hypothetical protein